MKKILQAFEKKDVGSIHSLVLHHHINPNALIPSKGVSLLHLIIGHQSETFAFRVVKLFLRCGGDPNVQSSDGVTPIHVAAAWGRNQILHLLLVNGGDPWMQDDEKKNAFNYAFEEREWNTIELLHHFQQMHSAANCRMDVDHNPKFEINLERVLLRKGEEMFAYSPTKKSTKSMMTQTQSDLSDAPLSPVQDKIRYFEPSMKNPNLTAAGDTKFINGSEKANIGWLKDFYQTSCEVVVHCETSKKTEEENKETFISSIHIDPTPQTLDSPSAKTTNTQSGLDMRGQLFVELQEAVRRRSKRSLPPKQKIISDNTENSQFPNFSANLNESLGKDSFMAKEVSYLYGVNLEDSKILKNMSDFATKVMKEIEVTEEEEGERVADKTIDLCISSPELTNYASCEDEPYPRNIQTLLIPQNNSESSNLYLTPYNSVLGNSAMSHDKSKEENSNESFVSVSEEYKYTDAEEGVVLLERKRLLTPTISLVAEEEGEEDGGAKDGCRGEEEKEMSVVSSTVSSTTSTLPSSISYNSDVLRCELKGLGYDPGPVTKTTKKLYLKKLWRLKKKTERKEATTKENLSLVLPSVMEKFLTDPQRFEEIPNYRGLEEEMCRSFEKWTKRRWRGGTNKTSFNYLLLDPRLSSNLPKRAPGMSAFETWKSFLSAVFYVGKGKRSRPYAHLYQATNFWEKRSAVNPDKKTERILDVWKEGLGVVCLQLFQNIIPVEALTREAAMIDALGLASLKNARAGEYYGVASTWPIRDKINLGIYLLHKAMLIFLSEGERQIKPYDID